jgi:hypothetical protein
MTLVVRRSPLVSRFGFGHDGIRLTPRGVGIQNAACTASCCSLPLVHSGLRTMHITLSSWHWQQPDLCATRLLLCVCSDGACFRAQGGRAARPGAGAAAQRPHGRQGAPGSPCSCTAMLGPCSALTDCIPVSRAPSQRPSDRHAQDRRKPAVLRGCKAWPSDVQPVQRACCCLIAV